MSSTPRKIAYNVVFSATAKMAGTVLALVGIGFITRYLGKDGFGDYSTVLAYFFFFGAIGDLGLYAISTREISRPESDEEEILGNVFSIRVASALLIVAASLFLAYFLPYSSAVKTGIVISALAYVFSSGYSVLIGLFQKRLAMDKVAIGEFVGKIVQVAVIVLAVKYDLGFQAIIWTLLLNMVVSFLIVFIWSRWYIKFWPTFDFTVWKRFLKESYPVGISAVIVFAYFKLDTILLSVMKTSADVGTYNAAYKVLENISFFPAMFVGLVMPIMSRYIFHEREKFELVANKTFKVFLVLAVPLFIGTVFLAGGIIRLIGGAGFADSVPVLRLLAAAMVFIFFGNFFTNVIIAGSLQRKLMGILLFCAVFNVSLNLVLIPRFSYIGAAVTSSLTEGLVVILSCALAWKNLRYFPSFEKILPILVSGVGMALVLYLLQPLNFLLLAAAGVAAYALLLWIMKAVSFSEVESLISKKSGEPVEFEPLA
ncbi:MAG TPA: flippase [Candidatus Bathyarchaeia archaeon]|nr:flippase [Candidatus Bathyarchaeia archaeon]